MASEFKVKDKVILLSTIRNIQNVLEEQETAAWQKLIRVLTHEIMNSITPVTSLAATAAVMGRWVLPDSWGDACRRSLLAFAALSERRRSRTDSLSGGMKRRLTIARSLINEPELVVLDEPTTGLDPNQIIEIRNLIKEIGRRKTVILSTHILPEVSMTCGRVVIINEGRVVAEDSPQAPLLWVNAAARCRGILPGLPRWMPLDRIRQVGDVILVDSADSLAEKINQTMAKAAAAT